MDAGLVTAMSGALAQSRRVEVIANNLANADTPGFKSDDLAFEESIMGAHQKDLRSDIPDRPFTDSELLSRSGDERRAVLSGREFTDLKSGAAKQTGNPLDIAIEGNGFLEVLTPNGVRLTRAGNLSLDPQGRIVTNDGFLVLGPGETPRATAALPGAAPASTAGADAEQAGRAITIGSPNVTIDKEGNIYTKDRARTQLGRLGTVQIDNPGALIKEGRNLFRAAPEAFAKPQPAPGTAARTPASAEEATVATKPNPLGSSLVAPRIHQGMLEASNVNPVAEMTKMIEAHRLFDQNTKVMQVQGDALGRLSDVGRF